MKMMHRTAAMTMSRSGWDQDSWAMDGLDYVGICFSWSTEEPFSRNFWCYRWSQLNSVARDRT